jgi:hypothetical protein
MENIPAFSLEQQFKLRIYEKQIENLTLKEAQEFLMQVLRQSMMQENLFKTMLKEDIGAQALQYPFPPSMSAQSED